MVDDLTPAGVRPLFMTDYIACGRVVPQMIAAVVEGIARACQAVDCALVAGETAEHPGVLGGEDFDVAGAATGVVDAPRLLGPQRVCAGDLVVGLLPAACIPTDIPWCAGLWLTRGWIGILRFPSPTGWRRRTARRLPKLLTIPWAWPVWNRPDCIPSCVWNWKILAGSPPAKPVILPGNWTETGFTRLLM